MLSELRKLILKLVDSFFPRKCRSCGKVSPAKVCNECEPKLVTMTKFGEGLFYLYTYSGSVKRLMHLLKFEKEKSLAKLFVSKIDKEFFKDYDLVIPVPCHWLRVLIRGFFHLRELFNGVQNYKEGLVVRKRYTESLYKLGRTEREKVMREVFKVIDGKEIKGKKILVVDDIFTSGTTYKELKKELEKYSPMKVEGLFLCRA